MGAATALYSATCFAHGKYGNGNPYPVNLSLAVGLSGWLPCARFVQLYRYGMCFRNTAGFWLRNFILCDQLRTLKNRIESSPEAAQKASSIPLLLCHGKGAYLFYILMCQNFRHYCLLGSVKRLGWKGSRF